MTRRQVRLGGGETVEQRARSRFMAKVRVDERGCWIWTACRMKCGYGQFSCGGRHVLAHRWAYEEFAGPIPEGLQLDHLCRVRCCVNPAHLEPVTSAENSRRGMAGEMARRRAAAVTHCPRGHEYTPENTRLTNKKRHCKACDAARSALGKAVVCSRCGWKGCRIQPSGACRFCGGEVVRRERLRKRQTHCKRGHEFTPENIKLNSKGGRGCRECLRMLGRKYRKLTSSQRPPRPLKTHCPRGHLLAGDNLSVRGQWRREGLKRVCRQCERDRVAESRRRRRDEGAQCVAA